MPSARAALVETSTTRPRDEGTAIVDAAFDRDLSVGDPEYFTELVTAVGAGHLAALGADAGIERRKA